MLPKWFNDWNRENPIDIIGPAIFGGVITGAVAVAAVIIYVGNPAQTDSLQTGPRGIGMSVPEFTSSLDDPDPTIEGYQSSAPVIPSDGAQLAKDAYENVVPELGDLTVANYDRLVAAMQSWTGIEDLLEDPDSYQTTVARRMIEMTRNINENWDGHVYAVAEVGVNCYTCHRGQPVPSNVWFNITPVTEATAGWASVQNRATSLSQATSLPSNAMEVYLTDPDSLVNVHDLESRVAGVPGLTEDVHTIQKTEMTYSLMNYFSNSLGVNCVFCHNSRAFYDGAQVTPQWAIAQLGRQMVIELNTDYLIPLQDTYPEDRLGPVYGDAPKAACMTCHKGYQRPMQGLNVIADWPELATTDAPVYE
jgi:photosynthetic reaction center cytochrome c subunit